LLDTNSPAVTVEADESRWYSTPVTIYASAYDYPSVPGIMDNSGVKSTQYCITESQQHNNDWLNYSESGVTFTEGGVHYLHIKAVDYAGNETVETKKIKMNTESVMLGNVVPTDAYTICNQTVNGGSNVYVVKNTAYNTRYHYSLQETDMEDIIRTDIKLVNEDNGGIYTTTAVETQPDGAMVRDIVFNVPTQKR
jgi:hypothetical protein